MRINRNAENRDLANQHRAAAPSSRGRQPGDAPFVGSRAPSTTHADLNSRGLYFDDLPFHPDDIGKLAQAYAARAKAIRERYTGQPVPTFDLTKVPAANWSGASGDAYRRMHDRLDRAADMLVAQYDAAARVLSELQRSLAIDLAQYQVAAGEMAALKFDGTGATPAQKAAHNAIVERAATIRRHAIAVTEAAVIRLTNLKGSITGVVNTASKVRSNTMPSVSAEVRTKRSIGGMRPDAIDRTPTRPTGGVPNWPLPPGVMGPVLIPTAPAAPAPSGPSVGGIRPDGPTRTPSQPTGPVSNWPLPPGVMGPVLIPTAPTAPAPSGPSVGGIRPDGNEPTHRARPTSYTVKAGNSWWQIADWTLREVGLTPTGAQVKTYMAALQEANPPGAKTVLNVGKVLTLPSPADVLNVVVRDLP